MHSNNILLNGGDTYTNWDDQVLKAQESYLKKLAKCLWFLFPLLTTMHLHAYGVMPYNWLTEEKKIRTWLTDGTTQKRRALQILSGTTLKDNSEGKFPLQAELWTVHMDIHCAWKDKWPCLQLFIDSWCIAMDWLSHWGPRKSMIEKLMWRISRGEIHGKISVSEQIL